VFKLIIGRKLRTDVQSQTTLQREFGRRYVYKGRIIYQTVSILCDA